MRAAIVTVGLGFGDEGKGAVVHHLADKFSADLVVRYSGGCQAGHNVETADGLQHTFSQFGSGSLAGVPTYLGPQVVVDPVSMHREAQALQRLIGYSPYGELAVHPDCLVTTFYHMALNRARELVRGRHAHGSCGMGVGAAREDYIKHGRDALTIEDLLGSRRRVIRKLDLLRQRTLIALDELDFGSIGHGDELVDDCLQSSPLQIASRLMTRAAPIHLSAVMPVRDASLVVFEGAQGTLLDEWHGFHPHTTWSDVTANPAHELIDASSGFDEVMTLGITRAFTTRHGAGPLPTYNAELTSQLDDPNNRNGRWQGAMRVGWLDLVLLRYAAEVNQVDAYAVTWLDQFAYGRNRACVAYQGDLVPGFMDDVSTIEPTPYPDLRRGVQLVEHLNSVEPILLTMSEPELFGRIGRVAVTGRGPSAADYYDTLGELEVRLGRVSVATKSPTRKPTAPAA